MEGPDLSGPSVWVDLNKKNGDKIIGFISKNKVPQKPNNSAREPDLCLVLIVGKYLWIKKSNLGADRMVGPIPGGVQKENGCCMSRANFCP